MWKQMSRVLLHRFSFIAVMVFAFVAGSVFQSVLTINKMFDPNLLVNALERIQNGDKLSVADFAQLRQGLTEQRQLLDLLAGPFRTSKDPSFTYLSADDVWILHSLLLGSDQDDKPNMYWDGVLGELQLRRGTDILNRISSTRGLFSGAAVHLVVSQGVTIGTESSLSWDSEDLDTDGYFASGSPTRFTIPEDGYYLISTQAYWATGTGARVLVLRKNGTDRIANGVQTSSTNNHAYIVSSGPIFLSAGDYVEARVNQAGSFGGDNEVYGTDKIPGRPTYMWIYKLSI